ncbi:MAG: 50S ribosome-binding GTPase [Bacilli bacterium]|nr:50S ribosome-binding GTPase [Bacilli bacterium]
MTKCLGCGALLQTKVPNEEGYVKDLNKKYCERCFKITHYNEYKFIDKENKYYLDIIDNINKTKDLVLLVTDFLNTEGLNELEIKNPVILVLTKRDIIPRNLDETKLLNSIKPNLNIVDKIIVGPKTNYNLDTLKNKIVRYQKSKNVYVIGYTSSGKSTLINQFIKNYSENKNQITTSILPSTTLDLIPIDIDKTLTLIDTPGLLDEGSVILNVNGQTLNKIMPKKEIKPITIQIKKDQTIIISNLFRLDVKAETNLTFYMSNNLEINRIYKETKELENLNKYQIDIDKDTDIVIKGLGFIKATQDCKAILYLDEKVKFIVRRSLI